MSSASKSVVAAAEPSTNFVDALISATVVCDAIYYHPRPIRREWTRHFEARARCADPNEVAKNVARWGIVVVLAKLKTSGVVEVEDVYIDSRSSLDVVAHLPVAAVLISNDRTGSTFTPFVGAFDEDTQVCCVSDYRGIATITLSNGTFVGLSSSSSPSFTLQRDIPTLTVDPEDPSHYSVAPTRHHSVGAAGAACGSSTSSLSSDAKAFAPKTSVVRFGHIAKGL